MVEILEPCGECGGMDFDLDLHINDLPLRMGIRCGNCGPVTIVLHKAPPVRVVAPADPRYPQSPFWPFNF